MGEKVTEGRVVRVLATAGWVVIVVAGMRAAGPLLVPLILSIFLALICEPAVLWLQRKRLPSGVAVPLVIAGVIL
ncbi:MAG: AI-2E family transporter, partial [Nitrospirales bacterium]